MDILFCDICSESVPLKDLESGGARRFGERIVCRSCDEAMTRHVAPAAQSSATASLARAQEPASPTASTTTQLGGGGTIWLAASCVGVMALLAYLAIDRVEEAETRVQADFALEVRNVDQRVARLEQRLETILAERPFEPAPDPRIDDVLTRLASLAHAAQDVSSGEREAERWAALEETVRSAALVAVEERAETAQRLADLALELQRARGDLQVLARSMLEVLEEAPAAPAAPAVPTDLRREAAEAQPGWLAFVGSLSSKDDSERWNAVEELGASGDPQAATYVVNALKDPELFVRMAAARVLGDLANPIAIAALIDTLADPEPSVREAALVSLRTLSGRDLAFEPNADPKVRAKQIEAWRAWWAEQSGAASDPG